MSEFDELRKAAEGATPGPWRAGQTGGVVRHYVEPVEIAQALSGLVDWMGPSDAAYVAAASPDVVLGLLDRIAFLEQDAMVDERNEVRDRLEAAEARLARVGEVVRDCAGGNPKRQELIEAVRREDDANFVAGSSHGLGAIGGAEMVLTVVQDLLDGPPDAISGDLTACEHDWVSRARQLGERDQSRECRECGRIEWDQPESDPQEVRP